MSRETDVLFCKIAINAGLVSAENAQQVIAFCNKREQDTGRRPLVGTVFVKNQLLTAEPSRSFDESKEGPDSGAQRWQAQGREEAGSSAATSPKKATVGPTYADDGCGV